MNSFPLYCFSVKDGEFRQYKSARSLSDLQKFINDEEWKEIAPGSSWSSPTSAMYVVAIIIVAVFCYFRGIDLSLCLLFGILKFLYCYVLEWAVLVNCSPYQSN